LSKNTPEYYRKYHSGQKYKNYKRQYRQRPEVKKREKELRERPETKEHERQRSHDYYLRAKASRQEYAQRPEVKQRARENSKRRRQSPEGREYQRKYLREWNLRKRYGISAQEHREMLSRQAGLCAICLEPMAEPFTDHDEIDGRPRVRGLLCLGCNTGLGGFRDKPERLASAIAYLVGHGYRHAETPGASIRGINA